MKVRYYKNSEVSEVELVGSEFSSSGVSFFEKDFNIPLVHQLIVSYRANARKALSQQKNRAEVKHSTRKPWRQKGTGRARSGMTSSPIWRGGGRAFPNLSSQNYEQKINRKAFRSGMASLLSEAARLGRITVCDSFAFESNKTRDFVKALPLLSGCNENERVLFVFESVSDGLYLAARNLHRVYFRSVSSLDPVSIYESHRIVIAKESLLKMEGLFV